MIFWLALGGLAVSGLLGFALAKCLQKLGAADEQTKVAGDVAKETQKQARIGVERRTDNDVIASLRAKAAAKRERRARGNSRLP